MENMLKQYFNFYAFFFFFVFKFKFFLKIGELNELIDHTLAALDYYNKYYKFYLGYSVILQHLATDSILIFFSFCISAAYIGWILHLISSNWSFEYEKLSKREYKYINNCFIAFGFVVLVLSFCNWNFFLYAL